MINKCSLHISLLDPFFNADKPPPHHREISSKCKSRTSRLFVMMFRRYIFFKICKMSDNLSDNLTSIIETEEHGYISLMHAQTL